MKKVVSMLLLLVMLLSLLTVGASAAMDPGTSGVYGVTTKNGAIKLRNADGVETSGGTVGDYTDFYGGAVKFDVTCTGAENEQYLLLVLSDANAPTDGNILYINQVASDAEGNISFVDTETEKNAAYPSKLISGNTHYVYVVGEGRAFGENALVATFQYYQPYTLGDVDEDGKINAVDALVILQYSVGNQELTDKQFLSADVDGDGKANAVDALNILQYSVGNPSVFD